MPPVIKKKPKITPKDAENSAVKEEVVSAQLQKKINKKQPKKVDRGVVFIKHLPHGFFEQQLKNYFEQFGTVTRLRLARSKRTGGSKGYAFVEFQYPEVAQVAAQTMDNYLMFKRLVKAAYIPPEKQQYNYFKTSVRSIKNKSGKTIWVSSKTASLQRKMKQHNDWTDENFQKRTSKQLKKLKKLGQKYADLGIDINKIIVEPKMQNADGNAAGSSQASKRKTEKETTGQKKSKKQPKLEDLTCKSVQKDSEDDSDVPDDADSGEDDQSSDEESYGFIAHDESEEHDEDSDIEDEVPGKNNKKAQTKFSKSLKSSNVERFDLMLKRKPHVGGIQKISKKSSKQNSVVKPKNKVQLSAAKDMAKPLSKIQGKIVKGVKYSKKSKKAK